MKKVFSFVLVCFSFSPFSSASVYDKSYGEAAEIMVPEQFQSLSEEILALPETVLPHEVKLLRKKVARFRYYLDIFVYAYPLHGETDLLLEFREVLDEGYDAFGNYKDLFDFLGKTPEEVTEEDYDSEQVEELREVLFKWIKVFRAWSEKPLFQHYLKTPYTEGIQERKRSDLSRFIWQQAVLPEVEGVPFRFVVKRLLLSFLVKSEERFAKIRNSKKLLNHETEENFHDFRKQLRYFLKTPKFFPDFLTEKILDSESFLLVDEAVGKYGDLNDLITKKNSHFFLSNGLEKQIEEAWDELRTWQEENCLSFHLTLLWAAVSKL